MGTTGGPLVANYRVSAGRLPETHWYKDRRQGGRLLGEVCHFIDLTNWNVGSPPVRVSAAGSGVGASLLQEDVVVTVQYAEIGRASARERLCQFVYFSVLADSIKNKIHN